MKRRMLMAMLFASAAAACAPSIAVEDLPSNSFEFSASRDDVKNAAVEEMISRGYRITSDSNFQIAFDTPAPAAAWLYGSQLYGTPNTRVTLTFTGDGPTNMLATAAIITNPGSGLERVSDMTNSPQARADFGVMVNAIKARLNRTAADVS